MNGIVKVSRRDFLKTGAAVGGGLVLACCLPLSGSAQAAATEPPFAPNAFLRVGRDGMVTIVFHKSEMGQGVYTALPMIVAEELECDWTKVRIEQSPVDAAYNHTLFGSMVTGGSSSVHSEWERLARAGAAARTMLVAAAADTWKVDPAVCRAQNGQVLHPDGRQLSYGKLAAKAARLPVPAEVQLKKPEAYRLIGKPVARLDSPGKVGGKALFGLDVQRPGMLAAVVARAPVFGGKVKAFSSDKTKTVPGVKAVVPVPSGVAVVADGFWPALKGRELLEIQWEEGAGARLDSGELRRQYGELAGTPGLAARRLGDVENALRQAAVQLEAEYEVPFLAHAPMEPLNCAVELRPDGCDIWTGTQMQTIDREAAARVAGLKPEQVRIHTTFLGGGFGRRANPASDFVTEAVQVAKAAGAPVKVIWTREDDTRGGYYRPCWFDRLSAGLDGENRPLAWRHTIVGQSIMVGTPFEGMIKEGIDETSVEGAADIPYAIPNLLVDLHSPKLPVPVLWWRSVGHSHTAFVVESFLDELAQAAGQDPVAFRRSLLAEHPRHRGVLELAAAKAGWGAPLPAGRGRGVAVHASFGSFLAQVAEVSVTPGGEVRVHRVVCAIDCGRTVNPDTIAAQMESGIAFGLTAALHGAITFKEGRVEQGNFDDYPLLRIDEMPQVEVHIVPSTEKPGGVGEPGVPPIAPAVANALFAACGARVRSLPLTPEKVLAAMGKG